MKRSTGLRRTSFKAKAPAPKPARQYEGKGPVLEPRRATLQLVTPARPLQFPKTPDRVNQRLRDSAKGEDCLVRIPGCPGRADMTIWSHAPMKAADKGLGIKALDWCGAYCCTYCDAVIDGQRPLPPGYTRELALLDWFTGHMRSLVRAAQKGLLR